MCTLYSRRQLLSLDLLDQTYQSSRRESSKYHSHQDKKQSRWEWGKRLYTALFSSEVRHTRIVRYSRGIFGSIYKETASKRFTSLSSKMFPFHNKSELVEGINIFEADELLLLREGCWSSSTSFSPGWADVWIHGRQDDGNVMKVPPNQYWHFAYWETFTNKNITIRKYNDWS